MGSAKIRRCEDGDFAAIFSIIDDGARAYAGVIPEDCWHEPYMPEAELAEEMAAGVVFWGYEDGGALVGVMGVQPVGDVTLIRHAYVRTALHRKGIGGALLVHLQARSATPMLVGTWAAAAWAIPFYEKHGFGLVSREDKERLLRRYWAVPDRQIETSVVLADERWWRERGDGP